MNRLDDVDPVLLPNVDYICMPYQQLGAAVLHQAYEDLPNDVPGTAGFFSDKGLLWFWCSLAGFCPRLVLKRVTAILPERGCHTAI